VSAQTVSRVDTLFKNAKIVKPDGMVSGSVAIKGEKIVAVCEGEFLPDEDAREVIDVEGNYLIPGIIDPHTHPGSGKSFAEDIISETQVAATGGVTTIFGTIKCTRMDRNWKDMTEPKDVISYLKAFPTAKEIVDTESTIDVGFTFAIMSDEQSNEIPEVAKECGVATYKFYVGYRKPIDYATPDFCARIGLPLEWDDGTMLLGFEQIAKIGGLALIHAENQELVRITHSRAMASGKNLAAWARHSPGWAEASHIATYAHLAMVTDCTLYVVHNCSKAGLDEIRAAKARGIKVISEVLPHYLTIDVEAPFPGVYAIINTPIQHAEDREALWGGIEDGTVECMGSDHVSGAQKGDFDESNIWARTPRIGISSTQLILPLMLSEGHHGRGIPLERIVGICCYNNARRFGVYPRKGVIQVGSDADLVVVDLGKKKTVRAADWPMQSSDFCIYEGRELQGWPTLTMLRGKVIAKDGKVVTSGSGQYVYQELGANP
jgi:dihydropyrimidinase